MDYNSIPFRNKVIDRLQKREDKLVEKGSKAVDEGRERKADRLLGRAAKVQDKKIRLSEKK
jgi:phage shock protein A